MKLTSLLLCFLLAHVSFSQIEPVVKTKTGELIYFEQVKFSLFKTKVICFKGDDKEKFKNSELESVITGTSGEDDNSKQFLFLKLIGVYSKNSSVEPGKTSFEVMIKNGENMIISTNTSSSSFSNSPSFGGHPGVTTYGYSGGGKTYYFIQGQKIKILLGFEWFTKEFLQTLTDTFENCEGAREIFENYYNTKGKLFKLAKMMTEVQACYLNQCLEI